MTLFVLRRPIISILLIAILIGGGVTTYKYLTEDPLAELVTTSVMKGDVTSTVSVSGVIESASTAELAFPTTGIVSKVYTRVGDKVQAGDVIATLGAEGLVATRASALAELALAAADRQQLVTGVRSEEQTITNTTVAIAEAELLRAKQSQAQAVENARRTLLNTAITARSINPKEETTPPIISGTYTCDKKGTYSFNVYASNAASGYSFTLTGLESGTFTVSTDQPVSFGTCGLFAKFSSGERYNNSNWIIDIPNVTSSLYTQNNNNYEKVQRDSDNAVAVANEAITLAKNKQQLENAVPRSEALTRANARVAQAEARVNEVTAQISDRSIIAPFAGIITVVDILVGETAGTKPIITLLGTDTFELKARIPEIDVTKIFSGQSAKVVFDAKREQPVDAIVSYIAPVPSQINGVAYFEIKLILNRQPDWVRSGFNADIDIITEKKIGVLVVPSRYVITKDTGTYVSVLTGTTIITTPVTLTLRGTDGLAAIQGVVEGTIVVSP